MSNQKRDQLHWAKYQFTLSSISLPPRLTIRHQPLTKRGTSVNTHANTPKPLSCGPWGSSDQDPQQKGKLYSCEPSSLTFSQNWLTWENNLHFISCLSLAEVWKKTQHVYFYPLQTSTRGSSAGLPALDAVEKCTLSPAPAGGTVFLQISHLCSIITCQGEKKTHNFLDEKRFQRLCTDLWFILFKTINLNNCFVFQRLCWIRFGKYWQEKINAGEHKMS